MKFMMNGVSRSDPRRRDIEIGGGGGARRTSSCRADRRPGGGQPELVPSQWHYDNEPETRAALLSDLLGSFSRDQPGIFAPLRDVLLTRATTHAPGRLDVVSGGGSPPRDPYGDPDGWTERRF